MLQDQGLMSRKYGTQNINISSQAQPDLVNSVNLIVALLSACIFVVVQVLKFFLIPTLVLKQTFFTQLKLKRFLVTF